MEFKNWQVMLQLYRALIRLDLEYCLQFWLPDYQKDVETLERGQKSSLERSRGGGQQPGMELEQRSAARNGVGVAVSGLEQSRGGGQQPGTEQGQRSAASYGAGAAVSGLEQSKGGGQQPRMELEQRSAARNGAGAA
eukprot:g46931.t1